MKTVESSIRTLKIQIKPSAAQRRIINSALYNARRIYNLLVEHLHCIRNTGSRLFAELRALYWLDPIFAYRLDVAGYTRYWEDEYMNILRPGWASQVARAYENGAACVWPQQLEAVIVKNGKRKGEVNLAPVVRTRDGSKAAKRGASGIPGQALGAIAQQFEASIKSCYTHRRNGNKQAELPKRFKSAYPLILSNQQIKCLGDDVYLFGADPTLLKFRLPELARFTKICDAKISRSRGGKYYINVSGCIEREVNPNLVNIAAIDFGQKRAVVIATQVDGKVETAAITGKDILALKRERDHRMAQLNRKRSRLFKGQFRQYLTDEEKQVYKDLERRDDRRQKEGKPRRGYAIKYAWRIIRQRRSEAGLRKFSRKDWQLKRTIAKAGEYYRVRLDYANHTVTRKTVDWAIDRGVGQIVIGDLGNLPKGRKKGKNRIHQVARNNRWEMPTQAKYLDEKLELAGSPADKRIVKKSEAYTSQTCPNCGRRHKPRNRVYNCRESVGGCGWIGDRDGVGAANLLSVSITGSCGNFMPEPLKTLPITPAIGQRLPMHRSSSRLAVASGLAEDSMPNRQDNLQVSANADTDSMDGLTASLGIPRKTLVRDENKVLASRKSLTPVELNRIVDRSRATLAGNAKKGGRRRLQEQSAAATQLTLWPSP